MTSSMLAKWRLQKPAAAELVEWDDTESDTDSDDERKPREPRKGAPNRKPTPKRRRATRDADPDWTETEARRRSPSPEPEAKETKVTRRRARAEPKPTRKRPPTGLKGVCLRESGRYGASISAGNRLIHLGTFSRKGNAAEAYDMAALKLRGPDAVTNHHLARYRSKVASVASVAVTLA